jgi:hypothetical protein
MTVCLSAFLICVAVQLLAYGGQDQLSWHLEDRLERMLR